MNLETLTDKEILNLILLRDRNSENAFRFIYRQNAPNLMSYCKSMVKNETTAEDIFQETFIRFYRKASSGSPGCSITGFLFVIARNLCMDHFRKHRPEIPLESYHYDTIADTNIENSNEQKIDLILSSMELLSEEDRELLILRNYNKLRYKEIAEILNTSVVNARKKVFRAKTRLKKIIEPYFNMFEK